MLFLLDYGFPHGTKSKAALLQSICKKRSIIRPEWDGVVLLLWVEKRCLKVALFRWQKRRSMIDDLKIKVRTDVNCCLDQCCDKP
jgi:hypothetical protein